MTGERRSTARRRGVLSGCSATGLGLIAGCMQPLLEEGSADSANSGEGDGDGDVGETDDGGSSGQESVVHVDDLELTEAWTVEGGLPPTNVTAVDGEFVVARIPPDEYAHVFGIDPDDGTQSWESEPIEPEAHMPALGTAASSDESTVYVGASGAPRDDDSASIVALDREGEIRWRHETDATGRENRIRIVVPLEGGVVYGADSTGMGDDQTPTIRRLEADGEEKWVQRLDVGFVTGLEYYDGRLYFAGTQDVHVYDAATGQRTGSFDYWPAFAGMARDGSDLYLPETDTLYRIDLESDDEVWSAPLPWQAEQRPVVDGDTVYVGVEAGYLLAVDVRSGEERWETRLDGSIAHGPVLDDERLWATDEGGDLYGVDTTDGSIVHHRTLEMEYALGAPRLDVIDGIVLTSANQTAWTVR